MLRAHLVEVPKQSRDGDSFIMKLSDGVEQYPAVLSEFT